MGVGKKRKKRRAQPGRLEDPRLLAVILFILSSALYLNTLGHEFVFDDGALILQNPAVTELRWSGMFGPGSYRPVRTLTYALNFALGGDNPFGYHLLNLLLHAVNAVLLFRLLLLWSGQAPAAFAGALIFAAHSVQTAAVAYISGRKDLLAAGFMIAALELYTRYRRQGGTSRLTASLILAGLAMLSKEVALVFPGLLLLAEAGVVRSDGGKPLTNLVETLRRYPIPIAGALLLAAGGLYHALFVSQATRMSGVWGGSLPANFGTSLKLFAHYLKLVFWPHPLIADYKGDVFPLSTGFTELATIVPGLVLAGFLLLAFQQIAKRPLLGVGMGWFLLTLLPVLQLVPFHELAADHFLYLPMAGVALGVAQLFAQWKPSVPRPAWIVLAIVAIVFGGLTVSRNRDWRNPLTLWEATYAQAPGSYRANTNLGQVYFHDPARRDQALELTKRALQLAPEDPVAESNLGAMEFFLAGEAAGRGEWARTEALLKSARGHLESALARRRSDGSILTNLGSVENLMATVYARQRDRASARESRRLAIRYFRQALYRDQRDEIKAAWYNMALVYLDLRNYSEAAASLERFLSVRPNHADANLRLGLCRIQLRDYAGAVAPLQAALQARPSPDAFDLLAAAYQGMAQLDRAITVCRQGLQIFPSAELLKARLNSLTGATPPTRP